MQGTRQYISNRLCELWDWRQNNGRFRQIACRHLLRRLESKGWVKLPPLLKPARRAGYENRVPALGLLDRSRLAGPSPAMREELRIDLVEGAEAARLFKGLIGTYHYLGYQQAKGAQVKYLVTYRERPVVCLSFGPAAFKAAARDQWIGWSVPQRQARLAWVVNNDRFLLLPRGGGAQLSGPFHKCIHVLAARHSGRPEPAVALPDISIVPPESPHYLSVVSPSHLCKVCRGATVRLRRGNGGLRVKLRGRTWEWAVGGWRQVVVFSAHLRGRVTARTE